MAHRTAGWTVLAVAAPLLMGRMAAGAGLAQTDGGSPADTAPGQVGGFVRFDVLNHLGGDIQALAVAGPVAWLAQGEQLLAYDISAPAAPRLLGGAQLSPRARRLAALANHVYALSDRGLTILDATDAGTPAIVGRFDLDPAEEPSEDMAVISPLVFISAGSALHVINVRDPARPVAAGTLRTALGGYGLLAVDGERLVALRTTPDADVVAVIEASVGQPPREVGTLALPDVIVRDLAAGGGFAFVLDSNGGVHGVDLSAPARPVPAWATGSSGLSTALTWAPGHLFLAGLAPDVVVMNLAPTGPPTVAGGLDEGAGRNLIEPGGPGVLAASASSVTLVAVADDAPLRAAGRIDPPQIGPVESLVVRGGLAYTAAYGQGLGVLDVHDPTMPREVSRMKAEGVSSIALDGSTAYLSGAMFHTVDITQPAAPADLATVNLVESWDRPRLAVSRQHVLVASNSAYLAVVDARDARSPVVVAPGDAPLRVEDIEVDGSRAYAVHESVGLQTLDVSDPAHPAVLGTVPMDASAVALRDGYAYAGGPDGLTVVDVSDPRAPAVIAQIPALEAALDFSDVVIGDETVYVLYGYESVQVAAVDIRNPRSPRLVGHLDLGPASDYYRSRSLTWSNGVLYLAGAGDGLWILRPVPAAPAGQVFLPAASVP